MSRSYGNSCCGRFPSGPVCFSVSWGHSLVGTGWNVTAYTCCIESVAELWLRAGRRAVPEKRQRRKRVRWKWTWTAGGPRNGEQKLMETKGEKWRRGPFITAEAALPWNLFICPVDGKYVIGALAAATMRWIPLKSTPLMSQHVRNHHLFNYLLHLYLRFYLWLFFFPLPLFIPCSSAVVFSGSGKSWVLSFLIRPHYDNSHKDILNR